ncbi:MAG: hypothetical protein U1E76_25375 [Planctomycetota bacterium]
MNRRLLAALAAPCLLLGSIASGQTLVTLEGTYPSGGEFSIHPPNACGYPNPSAYVWFLPDFASTCGSIDQFLPPPDLYADAAVDKIRDIQYMTDGKQITGYQQSVPVSQMTVFPGPTLPGPLTGMGYDSENDRLWLTDGTSAVAIAPPALGCDTPSVVIAAFALPIGGAIATDLDWDPRTDTLWVCDHLGFVTNVKIGGGIGPGGAFAAGNCSLSFLSGIAYDTCQGTLFVTDGVIIEHLTTTGAPGPATFYAPNPPCMTPPPPGPPSALSGLAFSPRPQLFGAGCATVGTVPAIGFTGSFSISPNPSFGITLTGAYPGASAVLLLGLNAACPPLQWGACDLYAFPFFLVVNRLVDGTGAASVALPIPTLPVGGGIGITVIAQWAVQPPVAGKQTSEGLSFTLSTL